MEYFGELALGPQCAIHTPWSKRHVDDIITIVKKEQVDFLFNHSNSVDPHIKFIMGASINDSIIQFLDIKCSPNSDHTMHASVYRKPTHTNHYLDWNSNHPLFVQLLKS